MLYAKCSAGHHGSILQKVVAEVPSASINELVIIREPFLENHR